MAAATPLQQYNICGTARAGSLISIKTRGASERRDIDCYPRFKRANRIRVRFLLATIIRTFSCLVVSGTGEYQQLLFWENCLVCIRWDGAWNPGSRMLGASCRAAGALAGSCK